MLTVPTAALRIGYRDAPIDRSCDTMSRTGSAVAKALPPTVLPASSGTVER